MCKKKSTNAFDNEYKRLCKDINVAKAIIFSKVENIIRKQGVISLYPEGEDKEQAIQDLCIARYNLVFAIKDYNVKFDKAQNWYEQHYNDFEECASWVAPDKTYSDSHRVVEAAYYNCHRR